MTRHDPDAAALLAAIGGIGPLARRLHQAHTRLWHEQVDRDVTGPQFTVLSLLRAHGPLDQGTLGALASLDKSTAAPLLERLRRRGLIDITRDDRDRRRKLVSITDAGGELALRLAPAVQEVNEQILARFAPDERALLLALMQRATQNDEA
ncbi:MarR family winged helix-turn-helix transcriptional regulator [Spirillospora sp. CA-253888]